MKYLFYVYTVYNSHFYYFFVRGRIIREHFYAYVYATDSYTYIYIYILINLKILNYT